MTLIAEIEGELKDARRARDDARRDALALILNALRSAEKELQRSLSEDESLQVLQRERKRRVEAIDAFEAAGRDAQADREEFELLPKLAMVALPCLLQGHQVRAQFLGRRKRRAVHPLQLGLSLVAGLKLLF